MSSNDAAASGNPSAADISTDQDQAPDEATKAHEAAPAPEDVARPTPEPQGPGTSALATMAVVGTRPLAASRPTSSASSRFTFSSIQRQADSSGSGSTGIEGPRDPRWDVLVMTSRHLDALRAESSRPARIK